MGLEPPSWLNTAFLAAALQGGKDQEGSRVTVKKYSTAPAVASGDNYLSRLYRVQVEYTVGLEECSTSFILKVPFTKSAIDGMADQFDFYEKEPIVYNEILPVVNYLIGCEFGPKSFYSSVQNTLVLADLKELGYEMCDRHKQLDFQHCKETLKSLAQFHAGSVACKKSHPEAIERAGKELFYVKSDKFASNTKPWVQGSFKAVVKVVEDLKLGKDLEEFIQGRAECAADSAIGICNPKVAGLNVLNHGDLWSNNVLFKHTRSGDIVDLKFIDFQIVKYATPVIDLIYFIWTSANEEVRESRIAELCEIYRDTLNSTLERLGCKERLTQCEFQKDIKTCVDWALIVVCCYLPITVSENDAALNVEEANPEDFTGSNEKSQYFRLFNGQHYRALLPKVLKHLLVWASSL